MRRPLSCRLAAALGLALLIAPGLVTSAQAQHTPDPYNIVGEYNLGYESSMYSNYPNSAGFIPNEGFLQGRAGQRRANQFQSFIEELDGVGSNSLFGRGGFGTDPYFRAHRQYDDMFNRVYTPNEAADQTYKRDQEARTKKYLEYLKTSDPKKRAQLYREYNEMSLRAARDYSSGSARAALRSGATGRPSSATSTTRGNQLRRPSQAPNPTGRTRGTSRPPSTSTSETPTQILERAELMDRTNRPATGTTPTRAASPLAPR